MINGHKLFIGLAERVEFLILFASTDPARGPRGVSAFLIDSGTPGYEVVRTIPTMGDAWEPCELRFDDCRSPPPSCSARSAGASRRRITSSATAG